MRQFLCGRPLRLYLNACLCSDRVLSYALVITGRSLQRFVLSHFHFHMYADTSCNNSVLTLSKSQTTWSSKRNSLVLVLPPDSFFRFYYWFIQFPLVQCGQIKTVRPLRRRARKAPRSISVDKQESEIVNSFKNLGTLTHFLPRTEARVVAVGIF